MSDDAATLDAMREENRLLHERVRELERLTALQGEEIRLMKLREHGHGSEKLSPEDLRQGSLFDEAELHATAAGQSEATEVVRVTKTVYNAPKAWEKANSA